MIFALSMADFATPAVLGGGLAFLAQDALLLVIGAEYDLGMASVLCVFLMLPSLGAFLVQHRWLVGAQLRHGDGPGPAAEPRRTRCWPSTGPRSFSRASRAWRFCFPMCGGGDGGGHAFRRRQQHVHARALREPPGPPLAGSLAPDGRRGGGVRWRSGASCSPTSSRARASPGRRRHRDGVLLGFALPGTVLGIGYVLTFNEPPLKLTGTFWILRDQLRLSTTWRWRWRPASASWRRSTRVWRRRRRTSGSGGSGRSPRGAPADGYGVPGRPHLRLREQHADAERHRVPHLALARAGGVGHLRVRPDGRDRASVGAVASDDRRGPRRPGSGLGGGAAEREPRSGVERGDPRPAARAARSSATGPSSPWTAWTRRSRKASSSRS